MTTRNYNPKRMTAVFAGVIVENLSEDGIEFEWESDAFTDSQSLSSEVTREHTNDRRCTVTLNVTRTAPENAALSAIHNADVASGNGAGIGPLLVRDELGNDTHFAEEAWILQAPAPTYNQESGSNAWRIRCASLKSVNGGS